ncbi:low molecular weight phosphotyrosine protein phosphatase [Flagellimonas marinaquae]|uniref:protein-tyrosine-phosphatase n=1 Tax=Flagellimonas aurea TaxID=2915619 RepID=A0ABS3G488_9FLAO|nr:low molecular weight protein-tyrosine-phosphatase [Allomuricauda aurea]MBC74089.1 protein-tyrosine-phosphatase [Allomuricauda sp.]MBO0354239.1 low molecular weight phosphotyrosine protein phosphatase [Allomuricauda aurea]UBZ14114.1 low molecular weight phosphotyrosine protein phosphatase [Allomuricauda aquimarina]|tara:strand:- start:8 stop:460 length:453 start_codon:yes stop_codon:yes gene_type:complete
MKTKVLMVCLGNICRSPLAEGILQSKVDPDKVFVDSAGTAGYHVGNPPDKRSVAVAKKHGLNINHQKCRKFSKADFSEFDHIYVMDRSNYSDVASLAANQEQASKVKLLLSEVELGIKEVPDPYYGGDNGFENVYQMIDRACEEIAKKLN